MTLYSSVCTGVLRHRVKLYDDVWKRMSDRDM